MSVVLATLQRPITQASGTSSLCEICQDQSHSNISCITICSLQPGLLGPSPRSLNSQKMMPLFEMPLPSELSRIALLHLCAPHPAHGIWGDGSSQHGCSQRSVRCMGWTREGCLPLLCLWIRTPWANAGENDVYYS